MGGERVGESGTKQEPGTERGGLSRPLTRWGATRISPASVAHERNQLTSRMMFSTECPGPLHAHSHMFANRAPITPLALYRCTNKAACWLTQTTFDGSGSQPAGSPHTLRSNGRHHLQRQHRDDLSNKCETIHTQSTHQATPPPHPLATCTPTTIHRYLLSHQVCRGSNPDPARSRYWRLLGLGRQSTLCGEPQAHGRKGMDIRGHDTVSSRSSGCTHARHSPTIHHSLPYTPIVHAPCSCTPRHGSR